ncbi:TetR/AcrR family transcriptional regulator [Pseudooceanicola sp. HF7]|uniref:TetR/AcrR family transcriptional regulator n=1 Tax=Pseudooceanicola sp. HF7 TaxID=2721560 RepID=UPI0014304981|nr:TetR/AcrR family transcriptional regulator [Pseudooceanicola sp. HF7]NIZ08045.1 TetR/AcrR family transcriptional regulator [Pseudooceanicola sp. HF7]
MASWNGEVASREEIREQKRRAALRIASRRFNEKGYHATSLDEIADEIGVTKTALYYYFRNKEELLYDCLQVTFLCGETARTKAEQSGGSALDRFANFYREFITRTLVENGAFLTRPNILALPEGLRSDITSREEALQTYISGLLSDAAAEGSLRNIDTNAAGSFFLNSVNWLLSWHQHDQEAIDPKERSAKFLDHLMNGIATKG